MAAGGMNAPELISPKPILHNRGTRQYNNWPRSLAV